MSTNTDLASMFHTMATILEIKGESGFKVNANTKVARALEDLVEDVASIPDLTSIPGVGKSSATKIQNYLKTGQMIEFEALRNSIPSGLLDVMRVQGLGPKKVRQLWQEADVIDIATLRKAIDDGRLDTLPRMGKKRSKIFQKHSPSLKLLGIERELALQCPLAESIIQSLQEQPGITNIAFAGSLRRGKETIGDIDILASTENPMALSDAFCTMNNVAIVQAKGETKCSVRLESGMQVDLRVVDKSKFGAALLYFTGSKEHNIILRERAIKQHKKLNEYELEPSNTSDTEEAIYADLGLPSYHPKFEKIVANYFATKYQT